MYSQSLWMTDALIGLIKKQDKEVLDTSVTIKWLLYNFGVTPNPPSLTPLDTGTRGVNLFNIEVTTFNGDLLNWKIPWEPFLYLHTRSQGHLRC